MKIVRYCLVALSVMILQNYIASYIAIRGVAPDFLLLFVLLLAYREGQIWGVLGGLTVGLLQDFLTAPALTGLSAFSKTLAAFSVGYFSGSKRMRRFPGVLSVVALGVVVHNFVYFAVYVQGSGLSFLRTLFSSGVPRSLYTLVFATLWLSLIPLSRDTE